MLKNICHPYSREAMMLISDHVDILSDMHANNYPLFKTAAEYKNLAGCTPLNILPNWVVPHTLGSTTVPPPGSRGVGATTVTAAV